MAYLLDSNVFIHAKNFHYGFDICPGFWDWLDYEAGRRNVLSIEAVYDELAPSSDELAEWVRGRREMFLPTSSDEVEAAQRVNAWAMAQTQFTPAAKADFASAADSWLVSHALAGGHIVVTRELLGQYKKAIIKIPNAAAEFDVRVVQLHQMIRELGGRFEFNAPKEPPASLF
jgi:predicted nucleic acid-binding protein